MKMLSFVIGPHPCVMPVDHVMEILPARDVLPMPAAGGETSARHGVTMIGILDYRGRAVPVMRLQLAASAPDAGSAAEGTGGPASIARRLLVVGRAGDNRAVAALEVWRVHSVIDADDATIQAPDDIGLHGQSAVSGVCRLNDRLAFVIDGLSLGATLGGRAAAGASHG
jgi:chemotaxis signal transduction protein